MLNKYNLLKGNHFVSVEKVKDKNDFDSLFMDKQDHLEYERTVKYKNSLPKSLQSSVYVNTVFSKDLFIINIDKLYFDVLPYHKNITTNYTLLNNISNTPLIPKYKIDTIQDLILFKAEFTLDEKVWDEIVDKFLNTLETVDVHLLLFVSRCLVDIISHLDNQVFFLAEKQIAKREIAIKTYLIEKQHFLRSKKLRKQILTWLAETSFYADKTKFEQNGEFSLQYLN